MARKLSANYVVFALEPCIRSEQYSQLGIEKIVEKICGVATSIGQKRIVSVDQNDRGVVVDMSLRVCKEMPLNISVVYICKILHNKVLSLKMT